MTTSKGGRPATGSVKHTRGRWWGRVSKPDGSRPWAPLHPDIPADDIEAAKRCAVEAAKWFKENPTTGAGVKETVSEYSKRWLTDREGRVNSIRDDQGRLRLHVLPIIGSLDVRTFNRDDVERLRDDLDRKIVKDELSWKTAANCWTLTTSMCADMVNSKRRELRTREDNPCKDVRPPERGADKAKQFVYPSEFLKFVTCHKVPRRWRRAVAVAIYTGLRDGELRVMRWQDGDVDLDHGVLSVTRAYNRRTKTIKPTKTGHTRRFAIEANLLPLLQAMFDQKGEGSVVPLASERAMARNLRRWLWKAGVRRPELHEGSPTRKPLTWHDLRASYATWSAVRGDDPLKIKQRCGHTTFSTTEIYIREAEAVREGFGEVFPALPADLLDPVGGLDPVWLDPNLVEESSQKQATSSGVDGTRTREAESRDSSEKQAESLSPPTPSPDEPSRARDGSPHEPRRVTAPNAEPDALHRELARARREGRWEDADRIARDIEARAGAQVIDLASRRK